MSRAVPFRLSGCQGHSNNESAAAVPTTALGGLEAPVRNSVGVHPAFSSTTGAKFCLARARLVARSALTFLVLRLKHVRGSSWCT